MIGLINKLKLSSGVWPKIRWSLQTTEIVKMVSKSTAMRGMCTTSSNDDQRDKAANPLGVDQMVKLKEHFDRFILENGQKDGLKQLDDLLERKRQAERQLQEYIDAFTATNEWREKLPASNDCCQSAAKMLLHPNVWLENAKLYFLLGQYAECGLRVWWAVETALERFVAKVHTRDIAELKLDSYFELRVLFECLFFKPEYSFSCDWYSVKICYDIYYKSGENEYSAKEQLEEHFEVVAKLISAIEQIPVDDAIREGLEKYKKKLEKGAFFDPFY